MRTPRWCGATVLAAVAAASACGSSSSTSLAPTASRCGVTLSVHPSSFEAPGGAGSLSIGTNRECAWEARSEAGWVSLSSAASGQGSATLAFAVAGNALVTSRRGFLIVNDQRLEISQAEAPCVFALGSAGRSIDAAGGVHTVAVSAQTGCNWTALSHAPWLALPTGASGQGAASIAVAVAPNDGQEPRTGTLTIAGQTYTVEQSGAAPPPDPAPNPGPPPAPAPGPEPGPAPTPPPPPPPAPGPTPPTGCTFTAAPASQSFPASGGQGDVDFTASAPTCEWTAATSAPWISINGRTEGTGSVRVRYAVSANVGPTARSGAVIVGGVSHSVSQAAPPPCAFVVSPTTLSVGRSGGEEDIRVETDRACGWTAVSHVTWITIERNATATGPERVRIDVSANVLPADRTGVVVVAGQTVNVTQAGGAPQTVDVAGRVSGLSGTCPGLSFAVGNVRFLTDARTEFHNVTCAQLRNGSAVRVRGQAGMGDVLATRVDGDEGEEDEVGALAAQPQR